MPTVDDFKSGRIDVNEERKELFWISWTWDRTKSKKWWIYFEWSISDG